MCDKLCDQYETFNPEKEYQKFLKTKPIVNTAKIYENLHVSERIKCPYLFKGYGIEIDENPMYRTVNSEYGYYSPNAYTIPTRNFPLSQKFSNDISRYGIDKHQQLSFIWLNNETVTYISFSEIKVLLDSLLWEIYGRIPSSASQRRLKNQKNKMHPKLYEKRLLVRLSPQVLKDICEILKLEIRLLSKYLERVLISRDKNHTHRTILYGFLDIIVSSRFGESSREARLSLTSPPGSAAQKGRNGDAAAGRPIIADETNSSSDFNQWLHAMKMVARLPGGMPPEFRRKLWLALADKYLKSKDVDWEKEEVKCFSEQWREDDEELGIQIVKDLHRTGSSLCSGPAGTINQAKLKRILLGYARFNPEVGYCQGFNMLGALILQVMDKEEIESIKVMIYLVEGILPSGYFSGSLGGLQADMAVFRELMTSKLPRLAKHLQKLQGPVENAFEPPLTNVFTMQWFLTMFCTCLPMTCVLRVWDLVLIEGSDVLLRTALVLWSLLEERILDARTADDFYCQMGSFSSELLNGHLVDSNGLIEKVVELGPIPELQKLRDKHLYNITPFRDKKGLQLYYSDEDGDSDEESKMAVATAWGLRLRRGSAGMGTKGDGKDRIALDISLLKKQYDRLRERQRQAHIILTSAVARQGSSPNQSTIQMNQLLIGRNAIVTNNGRRLGPPQGAIPPARKPSLPTSKPPKLAQTKKLLSGETLHWRDTDLSKRRRESLKWKDIKSDGSQSGQDDRPTTLIESAPSSRSSSSEPKSRRMTLKASRQRSDSSSYSEESDGNSSTSTSLCDEDEVGDHTLSSLEASPMRKSKSSKKHSEVTKQKSLEDVLNSNNGKPTIDNQIPFIQLTTIESPVLNANKTDIDTLDYGKEDSETESNRLDYAGFVDDFSWPDVNEPTSSVSREDTTIDATSVEGDFLSLSNVITSTSQLSPLPDITTYINNSNISPLRTPISAFDYANLVVSMDDSKKFDVNEEGVTNEYFERVIVERPTKLDLLYSLNEEDSIRNAYVSCEPSPESPKENTLLESPKVSEPESSSTKLKQPSKEELDRKMQVLLEYSNQSSLSFIAEAKQEISSGMFKDPEFDAESLKYQPATLVPLKKTHAADSKGISDGAIEHVAFSPVVSKNTNTKPPSEDDFNTINYNKSEEPQANSIKDPESNTTKEQVVSSPKNIIEANFGLKAEEIENKPHESNVSTEEIKDQELQTKEDEEVKEIPSNIPSTEDLETRFRALELNFTGRKESLRNETNSIKDLDLSAKRLSLIEKPDQNLEPSSERSSSFNKNIEHSNEVQNNTFNSLSEEKCSTPLRQSAEELKVTQTGFNSNSEDHQMSCLSEDQSAAQLTNEDNKGDPNPLSSKKHSLNNDPDLADTSYPLYQSAGEKSTHEDKTEENVKFELQLENQEKLDLDLLVKDSPNKNLQTTDLPASENTVIHSEEKDELSLETEKAEEYPANENLKTKFSIGNQILEEVIGDTSSETHKQSKVDTEEADVDSFNRKMSNVYSDFSDLQNQYPSSLEIISIKSETVEGIKQPLPSSPNRHQYQYEDTVVEKRAQNMVSEELTKTKGKEDAKNTSETSAPASTKESTKQIFNLVADKQAEDKKLVSQEHLHSALEVPREEETNKKKDKELPSSPQTKAPVVKNSETARQQGEILDNQLTAVELIRKSTISDEKQSSVLEEEQLPTPPSTKDLFKEDPKSKDPLSSVLKKDFIPDIENIENETVKNLSDDDKKQSLFPKENKTESIKKELLSEDIVYYQHHASNEDGSDVEGLNDQKQSEKPPSLEDQPKKSNEYKAQEKAPIEMKLVQEKTDLESSTEKLDKKDGNRKEETCAMMTTSDLPQSTYSFSYTQDHYKDRVSLMSEVQSLVSTESSPTKKVSNALQSTVDFQNSLQSLVAVTTSVSVRNSSPLRTSVSVKSSVSLKSSALYDRERSLHINTGVTVVEEPKFVDSKMILSNEIKTPEGVLKINGNNFSVLEENQNNAPAVNVVKSEYKQTQPESESNISLSMQLSPYSRNHFENKHSQTAAILECASSQTVDESFSKSQSKEDNAKEVLKKHTAVQSFDDKPVDQLQKHKPLDSRELEERFQAWERRFSDRAFSHSRDFVDAKTPANSPVAEINEPKITPDLPLEDASREEKSRSIPSTADLEHRFRELERKLSAKNITFSTETEDVQEQSNKASKQNNTSNPSIVLSKNGNTSPVRLCDDSSESQKILKNNEVDDQPSNSRKRIPSTEDLETRFEALEIQKSLKSPTSNLLSPSQIKEDFLMASSKSEIPSTEDLENRFQAFEQSKKLNRTKSSTQMEQKSSEIKMESDKHESENTENRKISTRDSATDLRTKSKEVPKVTFAEIETTSKPIQHSKPVEEVTSKAQETPSTGDRILRKVPSARDLEARFEALEKRKSFTGFSTKTQEYLLAEQNRNYLSSESLNSIESLKSRETNDKKVASTEDLVLRLDALEQRMAITESCIKTKISTETSNLSRANQEFSSISDIESRFESIEKRKPLTESSSKTKLNKSNLQTAALKGKTTVPEALLFKDNSPETKLSLIKRSLFEDKEPEAKKLPSTQDLENRFDALEQQKAKSLSTKKKLDCKEKVQEKTSAYDSKTKPVVQNWETRFEALDHQTPKISSYNKIKPLWENEPHSKLPSTKDLESRFDALEHHKSKIDSCSKFKDYPTKASIQRDIQPTSLLSKSEQQDIEKPVKALSSRSIDQVLEQISTKTEEIEREHQLTSKVPSTQDLEIRYHELQINSKRGDDPDPENVQNLEQTTDSIDITGNHKRRDLYKLESQSDETLTASDPTNTEFETKAESRPTSCPEYRDPFDSNIVTTDRVLKIIEENSKILHRILKKTLADSGGIENADQSRSGFTDSLLALGNIFPRNDESISPSRIKSQSRVRSTITFRSEDSSITDRLASIKSTIKSIDTLCEDQSFRKDKCQRYIDSLFTTRPTNSTSPIPPTSRPHIRIDDFESSSSSRQHPQERLALREIKKEVSPRRRRNEDREEYESRVRRDMMPNSVVAPSELSISLENIAKVDSEVDRINQDKQVETQLERPLSPYYASGYDLNNRSITPVVYVPTKLEIRHTTVTSTFYDRYLTEKHIERTFPRSKKHSPVSPTINKSYLDIAKYASPNPDDRSSKSAENSPSRRKDGHSPNQTVSPAAYKRSFISSLEVAQKDLHIRSCDNILLQLRSSQQHNNEVVPSSIMVYNPLPTKIRKPPELAISLGLYKDYSSDASSKS